MSLRLRTVPPMLLAVAGILAAPVPASGHVSIAQAAEDMQRLCDTFALSRIVVAAPPPDRIVVSLSGRPVAFDTIDSDVAQYFEACRPGKGACHREGF